MRAPPTQRSGNGGVSPSRLPSGTATPTSVSDRVVGAAPSADADAPTERERFHGAALVNAVPCGRRDDLDYKIPRTSHSPTVPSTDIISAPPSAQPKPSMRR